MTAAPTLAAADERASSARHDAQNGARLAGLPPEERADLEGGAIDRAAGAMDTIGQAILWIIAVLMGVATVTIFLSAWAAAGPDCPAPADPAWLGWCADAPEVAK